MCILLVEDEFLIRELAQEALEDAGREVLAAADGHEAYDYLERNPDRFTCLVTDYHMPGKFHGGQVIERTRRIYPFMPIVLASAYPHATTPEWRASFEVHLLGKPYFSDDLVSLVHQLLG